MRRARLSVTYPEELRHPLHRAVETSAVLSRAEVVTWSPTPDATTLVRCDGPPAATERALAAVESVTTSHLVATADAGTYAFLQQERYELADALLAVVADARVAFLPPVTFLADGAVRVVAVGETAALADLHDALAEEGTVTVERVRPVAPEATPAGLTDRQTAALKAAVAVGYYEVPREGGVADVADRLGCATSTAGELLRKAEGSVVRDAVE